MSDGCQNYDKGQMPPCKPESEPPVRSSERVRRQKPDPENAKPCPFCGGNPEVIHERKLSLRVLKLETFYVRCERYRCQVKPKVSKSTLSEALDAWNTRGQAA